MKKLIFVAALFLVVCGLFLAADVGVRAPAVPVQMIVTAEAQHGKVVPTLKPGDVTVYQRQERYQVTDLVPLRGENAALELFLLIDDSSSTTLGSQLGDLRQFIEAQPASTSIGVAYMRNGTAMIAQNLTSDHKQAANALRLPLGSAGAIASPFLSLTDLIKRWPSSPVRHEILMVSSGVDPLGGTIVNPYLDASIAKAQREGVIVYTTYSPAVGHYGHSFWRIEWGQNHLAQLAEETGGESYMLGFGPPVSFQPYLEGVAEHLAHQYLVKFLAKPENKSGLQSVRAATEVPNAVLVSATRVWVPASH